MKAHGVADPPVVEVATPAVHLRGRDERRVVDKRRHHASLVDAGVPQRGGELVIFPSRLPSTFMFAIDTPSAWSDGMP